MNTFLLFFSSCFLLIMSAAAQNERVIYSFAGGADGSDPSTPLISDKVGNLYGATGQGGLYGDGTIFELMKNPSGWTHVVIFNFFDTYGGFPGGSLAIDSEGNLYGTTGTGGDNYKGNVYELSPSPEGGWTAKILYSFTDGPDGGYPFGGVILDKAGNLYGTANEGGSLSDCDGAGCGVVFELTQGLGGVWTETVLHAFTEADGALPSSGLVFDAKGNLYGTTSAGGTSTACIGSPANGCGTVFRLAPSAGGWTETTLHSFFLTNTDGAYPEGVAYHDGKIYGTTFLGGSHQAGTVFELTLTKSGATESVLHSFGAGTDGTQPLGAVVFNKAGDLYGSASRGGGTTACYAGCGAIFVLKPRGVGWAEGILHTFSGGNDGDQPSTTPTISPTGTVLGTASGGGTNEAGVIFKFLLVD
jgi:uncharacterized repeat protein (TIGR03803 family)